MLVLGAHAQDVLPQVRPVLRVETGRGLVEEQQRRRVHQSHRHVEPAPLAAGQARDLALGQLGEVERLQQLVRRGAARPAPVEAVDDALGAQLVRGALGVRRRRCPGRRTRSGAAPRPASVTTSKPGHLRRAADVGAIRVVSIRIVVVLPAPFGPSTATSSPGSMSRLMPRTACTVSVRLTTKSLVSCSGRDHGVLLVRSCGPFADRHFPGVAVRSCPLPLALWGHARDLRTAADPAVAAAGPPRLARARPWPTGSRSARARCGATSTGCASSAIPSSATKGPDGGYRLDAGADLPPLLFDDEQAVAVAVALQTATVQVTGIEEGALRALATVRQVMPARLRQRVDALQVTAVDAGPDANSRAVDTEHLLALGAAVRAHEVLRFDYAPAPSWRAQDADGPTRLAPAAPGRAAPPRDLGRPLVPRGLGPRPRRLAHLPRRPDGAEIAHRPAVHAARPAGGDVASFIAPRSRGRGRSGRARARSCCMPAADEVPPGSRQQGVVEAARSATAAGCAGLVVVGPAGAVVGMFDVDIEVVGPAELRDAVASLARRYSAAVAV